MNILRDSGSAAVKLGDESQMSQLLPRYHASPNGVKVSAASIEEVRRLIDDALAVPDSPPPDAP
ncbi:MAG TPA: hypothetical protein VGM05_34045 [Planctomycetaceae bacterium]